MVAPLVALDHINVAISGEAKSLQNSLQLLVYGHVLRNEVSSIRETTLYQVGY